MVSWYNCKISCCTSLPAEINNRLIIVGYLPKSISSTKKEHRLFVFDILKTVRIKYFFSGLVRSKVYYRWPRGVVCEKDVKVGYIGAAGNRDKQLTSRCSLNDFTGDALTNSAGILFQWEPTRMLKVYWRRRIKYLCWWNVETRPRGPVRVGLLKMYIRGNFK